MPSNRKTTEGYVLMNQAGEYVYTSQPLTHGEVKTVANFTKDLHSATLFFYPPSIVAKDIKGLKNHKLIPIPAEEQRIVVLHADLDWCSGVTSDG